MKLIKLKNTLLTAFQAPLMFVLWLAYCLEILMIKSLRKLDNPLSKPTVSLAIAQAGKACNNDSKATKSNIQTILAVLSLQSILSISKSRKIFEATPAGRKAVVTNPYRHLYAILLPTKQENLKRIENVLLEMTSAELSRVLANADKMLNLY